MSNPKVKFIKIKIKIYFGKICRRVQIAGFRVAQWIALSNRCPNPLLDAAMIHVLNVGDAVIARRWGGGQGRGWINQRCRRVRAVCLTSRCGRHIQRRHSRQRTLIRCVCGYFAQIFNWIVKWIGGRLGCRLLNVAIVFCRIFSRQWTQIIRVYTVESISFLNYNYNWLRLKFLQKLTTLYSGLNQAWEIRFSLKW